MYFQASNAYSSSIVAGFIISALFWDIVPRSVIVAWAVAYGAMILWRFLLGKRFRAAELTPESARYWLGHFVVPVFLSGVLWGGYGVYLAQYADTYRLAAIILALGALVAGAVTAYAVSATAYLAFALPTLMPVGIWLTFQGQSGAAYLGGLVMFWMLFMFFAAMRFRRFAIESLGYQFDNVNLVQSLAAERDKAEELAAKLKKLSSLDSLTNIPNRRAFDEALEEALVNAKQDASPLAVIIGDVDYFKKYNDEYGHLQGDMCLRSVATALEEVALEHNAMAARIGGEEFAVILTQADRHQGMALAEALRAAVEKLYIPHSRSEISDTITSSFGLCALIPNSFTRRASLMQRADDALYEAKRQGRNRAHCSDDGAATQIEKAAFQVDPTTH